MKIIIIIMSNMTTYETLFRVAMHKPWIDVNGVII